MSLVLILVAAAFMAVSGLPGLFVHRLSAWGPWISVRLTSFAAIAGLFGAFGGLMGDAGPSVVLPSWIMGGGLTMAMDPLSAFFLVPIFLVGGLGPIYGSEYWRQVEHPANGRKLRLFWGFLVAGMALLVIARHAMLFLLGWETMALAAFFAVSAEDHLAEVRRAGWIYLIATHIGTLSLFAMFSLIHLATGSFELRPIAVEEAKLGLLAAIFVLALVGFGAKAGLMPLHFWLPGAHANAPSHVSALMSGVVIKMGVYGLVRIMGYMPEPPVAWGSILLILGGISGVLGVVLAIGQHDIKRLLAYHSVENIGIIIMGLGLAMIGRSMGRPDWILLGLAGCLLHVWNHSLFKSLLFLSAGSVVHAAHTRQIDQLGGLAKSMPTTSAMFLIGSVAICGLPPLNGFVSELLIYLGLLRTVGIGGGPSWSGAAMAAPVLAVIGALAVACFVKVFGTVFLGEPRSDAAKHAVESPSSMLRPMGALAACCAFIGLVPIAVAPILDRVVAVWASPAKIPLSLTSPSLAPLAAISAMGGLLLVAVGIVSALVFSRIRNTSHVRTGTWDCGYARPTPRMQYTASSFAAMLVALFRWVMHPRVHRPEMGGIMASPARFESHVDDPVLDRQIIPAALTIERWLNRLRAFQQGLTQHYILYILVAVVVMLLCAMPIDRILARLFAR
jgi:hydrogenase-4 component B